MPARSACARATSGPAALAAHVCMRAARVHARLHAESRHRRCQRPSPLATDPVASRQHTKGRRQPQRPSPPQTPRGPAAYLWKQSRASQPMLKTMPGLCAWAADWGGCGGCGNRVRGQCCVQVRVLAVRVARGAAPRLASRGKHRPSWHHLRAQIRTSELQAGVSTAHGRRRGISVLCSAAAASAQAVSPPPAQSPQAQSQLALLAYS
jgi:hypothetical protein